MKRPSFCPVGKHYGSAVSPSTAELHVSTTPLSFHIRPKRLFLLCHYIIHQLWLITAWHKTI